MLLEVLISPKVLFAKILSWRPILKSIELPRVFLALSRSLGVDGFRAERIGSVL